MEITVDTSQVVRLTELWAKSPAIAREEMLRAATAIDIIVEGELVAQLPKGAGGLHGAGLAGSVHHSEEARDDAVIGMVATSQPYAEYVELGTKPYAGNRMPPVRPIADWVLAKLGLESVEVTSKKSGKTYLGGPGGSAAFAIAKKIAKSGHAQNPVWQQTYDKLLPTIQQQLQAGLDRIAARLAETSA